MTMGRKQTRIPRWTNFYMGLPPDKREEIDREAELIGITPIQYIARLEARMKYRQKMRFFFFPVDRSPGEP